MQPRKGKFSLSKFFLRNYVLGISVLAFPLAFVVFKVGKVNLIAASERHSISIAKNLSFELYQHFFKPYSKTLETFAWNDPEELAQLDKITKRFIRHLDVVKINIFNLERRIVYSTDPQIIGTYTEENQKLINALEGVPTSSLELAEEKPDIEYDIHQADLLETYIPFRAPGGDLITEGEIIGAFELYQDVTVLYQQILKLRNTVFGVSFTVLLLFILYFRFVLARADGIQAKLRREIENHTENLELMVAERTQELREEKNKLQVILDHVPSAFVMLDEGFHIKSASAALQEITGKSLLEVLGQPCYEVMCQQDVDGICPTKKALASKQLESRIRISRQNDGKDRYLEHVAVPIIHHGRIESILEIITDVTEKKKLQDSIVQAEKFSAVGQMAATVAHEVRNSLTSVKLILQHLAAEKLGEIENKATKIALESVDDMEQMVQELLGFSRSAPISFTRSDINEVVRQSIDFCRQQIGIKRLKLQEEYAVGIPALRVDVEHLKEALINLILNAIQAADEQGTLGIKTEISSLESSFSAYFIERKMNINLPKNQRVLKIAISDDGCGISPEDLNRIFDPFFTTKIDGTGLGLPVARRVVHEHGGILTVESQPGQGSLFTILLPILS